MESPTKRAVVLLSGGLDSTTVLAIARSQGYECHALSFSYGQRHVWELEAAKRVAKALGAKDQRVAQIEVEPSGSDETFWATDSQSSAGAITQALGHDGLAASPLAQAGGLKLFALAGFVQRQDERLARAPGQLKGVIGAAPTPFDV